jgi:ADP-heptose:LPS heptosyltransferase
MSVLDSQNILVIHIAGLAQTTLSLPALMSLRCHLPKSRITVASSGAAADLLNLAGCVDEVLPIMRFKRSESLRPRALYRSTKAWNALRHNNFDIAIEFTTNLESNIVSQLVKARTRLNRSSSAGKGIGLLLQRVTQAFIKGSPEVVHAAHKYLKILEPLGVRPVESEPRLITDRTSDKKIEELLSKQGVRSGEILVGVHPGGGSIGRQWPIERFASVASRMIHNFNARVIVFAGPRERGLARRLARMLPAKRAIEIQSPEIPAFVSTAARLSLFFGNLSGPAHIAAAVGTPVVVASATSGPSPNDLLGRYHVHIRGSHVELITEEDVYEAACRTLKINRAEYLRTR